MKLTVRRIVREDTEIEMLPGESPQDAKARAIAAQDTLQWDAYDCEYWIEEEA